jgi:hypothetical protein
MKGQYIYIVKTDKDGPERGAYVQPSRKVYPTREVAKARADGVAPERKAIVVKLPEPVEISIHYYPIEEVATP